MVAFATIAWEDGAQSLRAFHGQPDYVRMARNEDERNKRDRMSVNGLRPSTQNIRSLPQSPPMVPSGYPNSLILNRWHLDADADTPERPEIMGMMLDLDGTEPNQPTTPSHDRTTGPTFRCHSINTINLRVP